MVGAVEKSKTHSFKDYTNFLEKLKIEFRDKYENNIPSSNSNLDEYEKLNVIGRGTYGIVVILLIFVLLLLSTFTNPHYLFSIHN